MKLEDLAKLEDHEIATHFSGAYGTAKRKEAIAMLRELAHKAKGTDIVWPPPKSVA